MRLALLMVLAASLPLLTACVSSRPLTLPDGTQGLAISCDGRFHDMSDCFSEAGKMCPAGYVVLGSNTEHTPVAFSMSDTSGGTTFYSGTADRRSMMVRCRR